MPSRFAVAFCVAFAGCRLQAAFATTTTLTASPNPVLMGQPVTLTATITPSGATGTVTFYDGANVLGMSLVTNGQATLTTRALPCCSRSLSARYNGDFNNSPSLSSPFIESVRTPPVGSFTNPVSYSTGQSPQGVAVGDLNGDGIPDLVVANSGASTINVYLGTGNGSFMPNIPLPCGNSPFAIAIGDFNGDGKPDLAVANAADNDVAILLGNGDGLFETTSTSSTGTNPVAIAAADFNGDGLLDVATTNFSDGTVSILLGNGNGTLTLASTVAAGVNPNSLVAADFNGDGRIDLAVADFDEVQGGVSVLLGNGNGTFRTASLITAGISPDGVDAADFNGDGKMDLAVSDLGDFYSWLGGGVIVLPGNGNGTFGNPAMLAALTTPWAIAAGDMNGSGNQGVAVATGSGISILNGNGDGTLSDPIELPAGNSTIALAIGDFNNDALPDVAVVNNSASENTLDVLLGTAGSCVFTLSPLGSLFDATGGNFTLTIGTNSPACFWTATADSFLTLGTPSGMGPASINVNVGSNTSGNGRTGFISIGGQSAAVGQWETAQTFSDVPLGSYFFDAANLLKQKNITAGCGGTSFCPGSNITRAQMAIFIVRAIYGGDNFSASSTPHFGDVQPTTFGFPWIQKLYELGITGGCGGGNYCPNSSVTRDQMAIFIIRARFGSQANFNAPLTPFFTDVPSTYYAFPWIQRLKLDQITGGCGGTTFCPGLPVTRGDMAIFLMRGGFNQLVPSGFPILTSVTPNIIARGATVTVTVTGVNTHFTAGQTVINPLSGLQFGPVTVIDSQTLSVPITVSTSATPLPISLFAITGAEGAVLPNGLTIQ